MVWLSELTVILFVFSCVTSLYTMSTGVSGGDEIANKGETSSYLRQCNRDIRRLQTRLRITEAACCSRYNMNTLLSIERQILDHRDSPKLIAALTPVADVNQGQLSVYPSSTPKRGSQSAPWAMHRMENSSVDNAIYTNTGYHPIQKTDPPPRNAQDGLNTSSLAAASSTTGVATGTQDDSGYASYLTFNDPYGYGTTGIQVTTMDISSKLINRVLLKLEGLKTQFLFISLLPHFRIQALVWVLQQVNQATGDAYDVYWGQGPAAFQNYGVNHTPSHFQIPPIAFSQGPTSCFPATHPGARTYASGLQSGSSMDTR
ncbi:hypothetical protein MKX01_030842 [Papaver californicum]|nr:hypothetical protein MKX01_030842 [Papaver californicum]